MRRITLWLLSTVAALVLLFSYRTSTGEAATRAQLPARRHRPGLRRRPAAATLAGGQLDRQRVGLRPTSSGATDLPGFGRADPLGTGPGHHHRRRRQDHQRGRADLPERQRPRPGDQRLRAADPDARRPWPRRAPTSTPSPARPSPATATRSRCRPPSTPPTCHDHRRDAPAPGLGRADHGPAGQHPPARRRPDSDAVERHGRGGLRRAAARRRGVQPLPRRQRPVPLGTRRARHWPTPTRPWPSVALCDEARDRTGGWFDPRGLPDPRTGGPRYDPSGLVKGWAVRARRRGTSAALDGYGWCVNAGGDVLVHAPADQPPWRVGIEDPERPGPDHCRCSPAARGAVATSGTAHRGAHIIDPHTGRPAVGGARGHRHRTDGSCGPTCTPPPRPPRGHSATGWLEDLDGYQALVVGMTGPPRATSGWPGS